MHGVEEYTHMHLHSTIHIFKLRGQESSFFLTHEGLGIKLRSLGLVVKYLYSLSQLTGHLQFHLVKVDFKLVSILYMIKK